MPGAGRELSSEPAQLLAEVRAAQDRVQRVKGTARVHVESPGLSGTITERLAAEKPDRVRLETLDFFGNPAAVLVASRGRFAFLDLRANVLYRGAATPENVSRLLPIVIPVAELVTILCGSAPLLPGKPVEARREGDRMLLTLAQGSLGQQLALIGKAQVASSRLRRPGESASAAYDLTFGAFGDKGGLLFPRELSLDAPSGRSKVALAWREDLEVNGPSDADLFRIEVPRGARVVDLDREGDATAVPPPAWQEERPAP